MIDPIATIWMDFAPENYRKYVLLRHLPGAHMRMSRFLSTHFRCEIPYFGERITLYQQTWYTGTSCIGAKYRKSPHRTCLQLIRRACYFAMCNICIKGYIDVSRAIQDQSGSTKHNPIGGVGGSPTSKWEACNWSILYEGKLNHICNPSQLCSKIT